jgi:GntR family transcriptional regulator
MFTIVVDFASSEPVYHQIAREIRALIAQGQLRVGDDLPSVRQLGEQVGVNPNTVARAYRILADEGLVEPRRGSSARVCEPALRDAYRADAVGDDTDRRLHDLISRWIVNGGDRKALERKVRDALDRYFSRAHRARGDG